MQLDRLRSRCPDPHARRVPIPNDAERFVAGGFGVEVVEDARNLDAGRVKQPPVLTGRRHDELTADEVGQGFGLEVGPVNGVLCKVGKFRAKLPVKPVRVGG